MMGRFTNHARKRAEQRNITAFAADMVREFGECIRDKSGCRCVWQMTKTGRRRLRAYLGRDAYRAIESKLNIRVWGEDSIITVGHRSKRFHR